MAKIRDESRTTGLGRFGEAAPRIINGRVTGTIPSKREVEYARQQYEEKGPEPPPEYFRLESDVEERDGQLVATYPNGTEEVIGSIRAGRNREEDNEYE